MEDIITKGNMENDKYKRDLITFLKSVQLYYLHAKRNCDMIQLTATHFVLLGPSLKILDPLYCYKVICIEFGGVMLS